MGARFAVQITQVRPLASRGMPRDEQMCPELVLESSGLDEPEVARQLFTKLCQLPAVRRGKQRAKIIELGGSDTALGSEAWRAGSAVGALR